MRFVWSLRRERYQLSINTHPQSRIHYRIAAWLAGAQARISHEYECFTWLDRWLVTGTLPQDYTRHSIENNFDVLPLIGAKKKLAAHAMEFFLDPADEQFADDFLAQHKLVGQKSSGHSCRFRRHKEPAVETLAAEKLRRLGAAIEPGAAGHPHFAVRRAGRSEGSSSGARAGEPELTLEAKTKNLRETAALMKRCSAFLSVDTALMHIAAAVKAPNQIVIEAPTLNVTNWPYGNQFTLVKNPAVNGRGLEYYRYDGGGIKGTRAELLACMESVKVADVFATVIKLI